MSNFPQPPSPLQGKTPSKLFPPLITIVCGATLLLGGGFGCFLFAGLGKKPWGFLWLMAGGLFVAIVGAIWMFIATIVWLISKTREPGK